MLGIGDDELAEGDGAALGRWIRRLLVNTDGPASLSVFGLTESDIPELARKAAGQRRLLPRSPRPVTESALTRIIERAFRKGDDDG